MGYPNPTSPPNLDPPVTDPDAYHEVSVKCVCVGGHFNPETYTLTDRFITGKEEIDRRLALKPKRTIRTNRPLPDDWQVQQAKQKDHGKAIQTSRRVYRRPEPKTLGEVLPIRIVPKPKDDADEFIAASFSKKRIEQESYAWNA